MIYFMLTAVLDNIQCTICLHHRDSFMQISHSHENGLVYCSVLKLLYLVHYHIHSIYRTYPNKHTPRFFEKLVGVQKLSLQRCLDQIVIFYSSEICNILHRHLNIMFLTRSIVW